MWLLRLRGYHLSTILFCPVFRCPLNAGPFDNGTTFDHSNTGLVRIQMVTVLPVLRPDLGSAFWCNLNELSGKIASDGLDFNDEDVFATNPGVVDTARQGFVGLERYKHCSLLP